MKKGIHPNYHFVEVRLNNGETYKTRTTFSNLGPSSPASCGRPNLVR